MPSIRDRNIGLWQDVRLKITAGAKIVDPQVITDLPLPDTSEADITIKSRIHCSKPGDYKFQASFASRSVSKDLVLSKGEQSIALTPREFKGLTMNNPKLWWPNGYGEPNLYNMTLRLLDERSNVVHEETVRFGVRELSYEFGVAKGANSMQRILFNPTCSYE